MKEDGVFLPGQKIYLMVNKTHNARVRCTQRYLVDWLARGFEVEEIQGVDLLGSEIKDMEGNDNV